MTFQFKIIDTLERFAMYENQWNDISRKSNNRNPFLEFDWIKAWWETIGIEKEIEIFAIFEEENVLAFMPLEKTNKTSKHVEYSFLAKGDASYMDILVDEELRKVTLYFILDNLMKVEKQVSISLFGLVEGSNTSKYLDWYLEKNNLEHDFTRVVAPFIAINNEDQVNYFHKRRKSFALNRLEKNFEQQGEVVFKELTLNNYEEIYALFDERWKMKKDTSGFSSHLNREFHRKLLSETDLAVVDGLFLDHELVAYTFGYRFKGTYIGFSIAFNPNFDCFGLGNILDRRIIEKSFEVHDEIFDFSIGFESYKFNWATEIQYIRNYYLGNKYATKVVKRQNIKNIIIEKVKKNKSIVNFKRNTLGKIQYYLRHPIRFLKLSKDVVSCNFRDVYTLQAKSLQKEKVEEKQVPLIGLQKMKNKKYLINSSFKEGKYYLVNDKSLYEVNHKLIVDAKWDSTIELPKNAVYINGPIDLKDLSRWNDREIFILIKPFESKKKKKLIENDFTKLTSIKSMHLFKYRHFSSKGLKLKSPKRYKFTS